MSNSLRPHELQHARPPCPSPTPRIYSNSCLSSQWCHPAISSSVLPFSSCSQSLPASGSFPMCQLFTWGGQSIRVSASASISRHIIVTVYLSIYIICNCGSDSKGSASTWEIGVRSLSCMERGAWQTTVHEVCKESDITEWLTLHFIYNCIYLYTYQHTHFLYLCISQPPLYLDVPYEWILANRMQAEVISSPQTACMYYFSLSFVILWMNNNTCVI